jgi:hypothetical protein
VMVSIVAKWGPLVQAPVCQPRVIPPKPMPLKECLGRCKSGATKEVACEFWQPSGEARVVKHLILHDVDRCPEGAVGVAEDGWPVFPAA